MLKTIDLIFIIRYNMKNRINLKMKELKQSWFNDKQPSLEVILVSVDFDFAEQYHNLNYITVKEAFNTGDHSYFS